MRPRLITRRHFLAKSGLALGAIAVGQALPWSLPGLWRKRGGWLPRAHASPGVVLNPMDPLATFKTEGTQQFTSGTTQIQINDASGADLLNFFAADADAAGPTDLVATFSVPSTALAGADTGGLLRYQRRPEGGDGAVRDRQRRQAHRPRDQRRPD